MAQKKKQKTEVKPWGGRFSGSTDKLLETFSASVHFDHRLYPYDIAGSIAHARMLGNQGLVTKKEAGQIIKGLKAIKKEIDAGKFTWKTELEDVHMNIERALTERIGPAGEKLHTARSRNDQVALDTRLYLRDAIKAVGAEIKTLRTALVKLAAENQDLVMPGYTHLQRAQPILLAHHLLAYNEMLKRDNDRLADLYPRVDIMPLGSAALAGTGLPIDMKQVAKELGFSKIVENSLDGVSARDYIIEYAAAASIIMMHLSRLSEDIILWASSEFGFVDLPDELCTGSSIMPQKKNPDLPELVRGKTGRVYGDLMALLTITKGLPMSYNKDLQEDKEPLFDTTETLMGALPMMARLTDGMKFNAENMARAADDPYMTATDLADHLVKQGVPFRQAHSQVGELVAAGIKAGKSLAEFDEKEIIKHCPKAKKGVKKDLSLKASIKARTSQGGTAPKRVKAAIKKALMELEVS